jgi:steroid delta-isomerase-like uncharacterized protein
VSEENKAIARRYCEEVINLRKLDVLDEIVSDDFVLHCRGRSKQTGPKGLREDISQLNVAFPDRRLFVHDLLADEDKVFFRFTNEGTHSGTFLGLPPTGKRIVWSGMEIMRLADGKIMEAWGIDEGDVPDLRERARNLLRSGLDPGPGRRT